MFWFPLGQRASDQQRQLTTHPIFRALPTAWTCTSHSLPSSRPSFSWAGSCFIVLNRIPVVPRTSRRFRFKFYQHPWQVIPAALAEYKATVGKDCQVIKKTSIYFSLRFHTFSRSKWTQRIGWEPTKLEVSRFLHRRARLRCSKVMMIVLLAFFQVDNTLEARLAMVSQQILPSMRSKLFGANPSRKFFD